VAPHAPGERLTVPRAVAALVVLAAAVRVPLLGARVAHWDEARVAWWTLQYAETGTYRYYPILHGPLLPLVTRPLLETFGRSDLVLRLPTAVLGSLLPAAALLFRDPGGRTAAARSGASSGWRGLADRETVALAGLLAFAPLLVFYSRFFRNDLPVAALSLAALGCLLRVGWARRERAVAGRAAPRLLGRPRGYIVAAGALLALALGAKENALLYALSWVGAGGLLWAADRAFAPGGWPGVTALARAAGERLWASARRWWADALAGTGSFLLVVVLVFAPRTGGERPGIEDVPARPGVWPDVVGEATLGTARRLADVWVAGDVGGGPYPEFLGLLVGVTLATAAATVGLAVVGLVAEHRDERRSLVGFAALWAGLGVVGYPLAADLMAGWTALHVAVPLTLPAAVGLVALAENARPALAAVRDGDGLDAVGRSARLAAVGLLLVGLYVGGVGGVAVFGAPAAEYNPYPQPAQPEGDLGPAMDAVGAAVAAQDDPKVVYLGSHYSDGLPAKLPVAWYVRAAGGDGTVGEPPPFADGAPTVLVTLAPNRPVVEGALDGYACWRGDATAWVDREPGGADTLVYVDRAALPGEFAVRGTNCGG
jgi:uncharacterized protein (TIGR03663 family)